MARAIQLARKGLYTTDPNPRVGCVLVKDGHVIGEGWHKRAGLAHAEIEALVNTTESTEGATAYVSLEPCSHHGRTPPCCEALAKTGITRVVAAMQDPNPKVAGRGLAFLQAKGISVSCGILEDEAKALNQGFIQRMAQGRPYIRSKLAMSLDGRTAMASGESQWITSAESRADVHRLRAQSSAIMTGINTVLADDPALTARVYEDVVQPIRVVLDSTLLMPITAKMATQPGRSLVLTCIDNKAKQKALEARGFEVHLLTANQGRLDLKAALQFLATQEINEVLVEAGAILNGALLVENCVDEWLIYMSPTILGDQGKGLFTLPGLDNLEDCQRMKFKEIRRVGQDLKLTLRNL